MAKHPEWTAGEVNTLQRYSGIESDEDLTKRLPGRSLSAIQHKRHALSPQGAGNTRWSQEDLATIMNYWGTESGVLTAARIGRTVSAVRRKLWRLYGSGSVIRGQWTMGKLVRYSGYDHLQIGKAIEALRIQTKRTLAGLNHKPWHIMSEDQVDRILEWLKVRTVQPTGEFLSRAGNPVSRWGRFHDRCLKCGTNGNAPSNRHCSKGLCDACYKKQSSAKRAALRDHARSP